MEARTVGADAATRTRRTRVDAERNRQRILRVARDLYATAGVDLPLETIARSAGVGIATLYRHFPRGKEQLVAEALVEQASRYLDAARRALAEPDGWVGFTTFVEEICAMQADHLGLADLLAMVLPADEQVEAIRRQANDACVELIDKAKATGELREDFAGEDLLLVLMANAAVLQVTRDAAPNASPRLVSLFLQAVATRAAITPLPAAPSSEQMREAMVRLAGSRGCAAGGGPVRAPG
ncbi:MAG TPA: helix-turn-helix domain-containing protein [Acidimicrobiales bacterium]|nr:helix-turn-helix domain-containing protein [Acidimicrobiales bacterium]